MKTVFEFGSIRLVLIRPGELRGRSLTEPSQKRLEGIYSSFKTEEYLMRKFMKKEMGQLLNKFREKELGWRDLPRRIRKLITTYREKERKAPIESAKLYQGGDERLEVKVTVDFVEDLLGKEAQIDRSFGDSGRKGVKSAEGISRAVGHLEKRSFYNIVVCPAEVIYRYLNYITEQMSRKGVRSMGERLNLKPGFPVLFDRSTLEKKLTIEIPVELEDRIHPEPFSLIYKEQ